MNKPHINKPEYLQFTLIDQESQKTIKSQAEYENGNLCLRFNGYGDSSSEDGHGCPVMIEFYNNELRVVVWGNINEQDPTHIIPLTKAKESLREK